MTYAMLSKLFCFTRSKSHTYTLSKNKSSRSSTSDDPPRYVESQSRTVRGIEQRRQQHSSPKDRALILDLGDVLFHYDTSSLALPRSTFYSVILSPTWNELECGRISEDEALAAIGKELSLDPETIHGALSQARQTLRVDHELYAQLLALKDEMEGNLKVFAMTNIAKDDFLRLKAVLPSWNLFDEEFTSCEVGMIKPELGYYQYVLREANLDDPSSVIFVDDKVANVVAARSFGIHGIVYDSAEMLMRRLRNQLFDPIARACEFMRANARNHVTQVEDGPMFRDVFSQFLIHTVLQDASIISLSPGEASTTQIEQDLQQAKQRAKQWNYFAGPPVGTTAKFPADVDDTAMALLAFSPPASSASAVLDTFLANRHSRDGLVQTYFDKSRPRVCAVVLVNVCRVFYHYNRGEDIQHELQYVRHILSNRACLEGTAMYLGTEPFLYFLSCLVQDNLNMPEVQSLREPLASALRERVGRGGDSFRIASRALACQAMGVWVDPDISDLKELQLCDGGWEIGWVCRYGRTQKRIGSRGVATAFAIKVLEHEAKRS
ncbi:hypothetical protein HBH69_000840 [Parastagonospora nodorum]|nr:hypothetical protein HBH51_125460 [Parastagonospora nodorum]KAH3990538.1 hypothetical protein HBH52_010300 [Parastagonospora nodorum]KAH4007062.1 hypothetical protein HBI10_020720 [Parastagonospora nodorum]KAH4008555.1 hypothetical protein HBI13_235350 [Parastagonospora nodorum]KAH4025524.1 hypothetical protein HBI09_154590 [Parastagonospora nodorum]